MKRVALLLTIGLGLTALPASAQLVFLEAIDCGFYSWDGNHYPGNTNYVAGDIAAAGVAEYRNFFVFDLSGVTGTVAHAALQIYNPSDPPDPGNGFNSPDPYERYSVQEVTTDIATLTAGGSGLVSVFGDLGDGTVFGFVDADAATNGTSVLIPLNHNGEGAVNAAIGGQLAFGGAVTTLAGNPIQTVFAYSNGSMRQRLLLDLGGTVFWDDFETGSAGRWDEVAP
jgi:hypothetical protein